MTNHLSAQAWRRPQGKVHPGQPQSLLEPTPRTFYHHFSLCKLTIAILRANISETVTCGLLGDQELLGRLCQPPPAGQFLRFFESFLKPALLLSLIPCRASGAANKPEKLLFNHFLFHISSILPIVFFPNGSHLAWKEMSIGMLLLKLTLLLLLSSTDRVLK